MTYCTAVLVEAGLVIVADTRTNAGLDNISTFRKLHLFQGDDRTIALAAAGNLSITQSVVSLLKEGIENQDTGEMETVYNAKTMFRAAQLVGRAIRRVRSIDGRALEDVDLRFDCAFLFGGQIAGSSMKLYMIYSAGNFIECSQDAPFLQIGEHKYGKPILDRAIFHNTDLYDALKIALISMDSTMRSNLSVGMPIDLAVIRRDVIAPELVHRIEVGEPYFHDLRERWSTALRAAHMAIPIPPYGKPRPSGPKVRYNVS